MTTRDPIRMIRPDVAEKLTAVVRSIESRMPAGRTPPAAFGDDRSVTGRLDRIDEALGAISLHLHGVLTAKLDTLAADRAGRTKDANDVVTTRIEALSRSVGELATRDGLEAVDRHAQGLKAAIDHLRDELPHRVSDAVMRSGEVVLKAAGTLWSDVQQIRSTTQKSAETSDVVNRVLTALSQTVDRAALDLAATTAQGKEALGRLGRVEDLLGRIETVQRSTAESAAQFLSTVEKKLDEVATSPDPGSQWRGDVLERLGKLDAVEANLQALVKAPDAIVAKLDQLADELAETKRVSTIPPQDFDAAKTSFQRLTTGFRVVLRQLSDDAAALRGQVAARAMEATPVVETASLEVLRESLSRVEAGLEALHQQVASQSAIERMADRLQQLEARFGTADQKPLLADRGSDFSVALAAAPELDVARTHVQQLLVAFRVIIRQLGEDARSFGDIVTSMPRGESVATGIDVAGPGLAERIDELATRLDRLASEVVSRAVTTAVGEAVKAIDVRLDRWDEDLRSASRPSKELVSLPMFEPERGQMQRLVVGFAQLVQAANAEVERLKTMAVPVHPMVAPSSSGDVDLVTEFTTLRSELSARFTSLEDRIGAGHAVLADLHALSTRRVNEAGAQAGKDGFDHFRALLDQVSTAMDSRLAEVAENYERIGRAVSVHGDPGRELSKQLSALDDVRRGIAGKVDEFIAVAAALSAQIEGSQG